MIILKAEVFNDDRHTRGNIAVKLETMLMSWEITKENIMCIVRDGGTKMKKGISLLGLKNIDCAKVARIYCCNSNVKRYQHIFTTRMQLKVNLSICKENLISRS